MSTAKLSRQEAQKLIKFLEEECFKFNTKNYTSEKFAEIRTTQKTEFRNEIMGNFWVNAFNGTKEYLRKQVYAKVDKLTAEDHYEVTAFFHRMLEDHFKSDIISEITGNFQSVDKLAVFKNTVWVFYYYDDLDDIHKTEGIATGVLKIDEEGNVEIKDKLHSRASIIITDDDGKVAIKDKPHNPKNTELVYSGDVVPVENGKQLLFTMQTKVTKERNLHILLHVTNDGKVPEIALGQYHNIDDKLTIVSGTLLVAQTSLDYDAFEPTFFPKGSDEYEHEIVTQAKQFLEAKHLNRIKVSAGIFTYQQLQLWLRKKQSAYNPTVPKGKSRAFISAPITSITNDKFEAFKADVNSIVSSLETHCSCNAYCSLLKLEKQDGSTNDILLRDILAEMNKCQIYVLIIPPIELHRQTSALLEFGYLYHKKIPTVIFAPKTMIEANKLPNLLMGSTHVSGNHVRMQPYDNIEDILYKIQTHKKKLFDF